MKLIFSIICCALLILSTVAQPKQKVDVILKNAHIYTVDANFSTCEAMAIKKGVIVFVGSNSDVRKKYTSSTIIDAQSKAVFPGFIDSHLHFFEYSLSFFSADLLNATSYDDCLRLLKEFDEKNHPSCVFGMGWNNANWDNKELPTKEKLDKLFPNKPVVLQHVDGHTLLTNSYALQKSGITNNTKTIGGEVKLKDGELTGVLSDNARRLLYDFESDIPKQEWVKYMKIAQEKIFEQGVSSVTEAGNKMDKLHFIDSLQRQQDIKLRFNVMLSLRESSMSYLSSGKYINTDMLHAQSIKTMMDGTLMSQTACKLCSYANRPTWKGLLRISKDSLLKIARFAYDNNLQLCAHAVGDSTNRVVLDVFGEVLKSKNDRRWRIEHASNVNKDDLVKFKKFSIVPSIQLFPDSKTPLITKPMNESLLGQNNWLAISSDCPVSPVNQILNFYLSIGKVAGTITDPDGFIPMSREQALKAMTIWAAKAGFDDKKVGSIEVGKLADFVILDQDIMKVSEECIKSTKVLKTFIAGKLVYKKK